MESTVWIFTGIAVPTLLALGYGAMQMTNAHCVEFRIARVCFWLAGIVPTVAIQYSLFQSQELQRWYHVFLAIGSSIVIGVGTGLLLTWVALRERRCLSPETSRLYVVTKQLKSLLAEGDRMVNRFQMPGEQRPSEDEISKWIGKVNQCAEQPALEGHVDISDITMLHKEWDHDDAFVAHAVLTDFGHFDSGNNGEGHLFRATWGYVRRLAQFLAKIEKSQEQQPLLMVQTNESLAAVLEARIEKKRDAIKMAKKAELGTLNRPEAGPSKRTSSFNQEIERIERQRESQRNETSAVGLQSRIRVSCGRNVEKSVILGAQGTTYFRARLDLEGIEPIRNITAAITAIRQEGTKIQLNEEARLTFHPGYPFLEELREGIAGFLDVVKIKGNGKLALALIGEYPAVDAYCCNYPGHTYEFDVSITAANARTRSYTFLFYWTGDRKSSDFTFLEAVSKRVPELENKLGQITLARSGTGIIRTIESRLLDINEFLKKYEPLLEYAYERNSPPNPPPNIPLLHEINDHLIQDCFAVELETGGIAFRELAKLFTEMNREIHVFNDLPTPRGIQRIRKFSEQVIPEVIQRAKNECP